MDSNKPITPEKIEYDIDALKALAKKRLKNIEVFEKAILDELDQIEREQQIITILEEDLKKKRG